MNDHGSVLPKKRENTASPGGCRRAGPDGHLSPVRGRQHAQPRVLPVLAAGEGLLAYEGAFYIEPLEVQIEFLKAPDSEQWLKALLLRHAHRVRQVSEELFVIAEIKEVVP